MKIALSALLMLSILLGPGYYIYCNYFSGSSVRDITVFSQDAKNPDASNNYNNATVMLDLDKTMNPISIIASITYKNQASRSTGTNYLKYRVMLEHDNSEQWNKSINLVPKPRKKQNNSTTIGSNATTKNSKVINTFSVQESGEYSLNIKKLDNSKTQVKTFELNVRKNVTSPNMAIVISGIIGFIISIVGFIFIQRLKKA